MKIYPPPVVQYSPADPSGVTDQSAALAAAAAQAAAAGANLVLANGAIIGVASPFVLPNGVGLDFNGATLKALTGLSGGVLQLGKTGTGAFSYTGTIFRAKIDCNEIAAAKGIDAVSVKEVTILVPQIWKCRTNGIHVQAGFQFRAIGGSIWGSSPRSLKGGSTLPSAGTAGLKVDTADCEFTNMAVQHFQCGIEDNGGGNSFVQMHAWSTYYSDDVPMNWCFKANGLSGNFAQCRADSPRTVDNTNPASASNGGIGFLITAQGVKITDGTLVVSDQGNTPPANNTLIYSYNSGGDYCSIIGGDLVQLVGSKVRTIAVVFDDFTKLSHATVIPGAGLSAYSPQTQYIAGSIIAGTPTISFSSSNSGFSVSTASSRFQFDKTSCHVKLRYTGFTMGSASGNVTLGDLAVGSLGFEPSHLKGVLFWGPVQNVIPVVLRLADGASSGLLYNELTGANITHASIDADTEIEINDTLFYKYQGTDGT